MTIQRINSLVSLLFNHVCSTLSVKESNRLRPLLDVFTLIIYLYHVITSRVAEEPATPQPHVAELLPTEALIINEER